MPSRFADIYTNFAVPALSEQLGEVQSDGVTPGVVRYPLGDLKSPALVRGIWCEEEASDDQQRGHEVKRKVFLTIFDTTVPVDARDIFALVASFDSADDALTEPPPLNSTWAVRSIVKGTEPANVLELERRDLEIRTGKGGRVL